MRRIVVLPEPEGPSSVKKSRRYRSRSTSRTATRSPKRLVTPRRRTLTSGAAAGGPSSTSRPTSPSPILASRRLLHRLVERRLPLRLVTGREIGRKHDAVLFHLL